MIKWSRVQLGLSIITAAGLWQTLRERIAFTPLARNTSTHQCKDCVSGDPKLDIKGAVHVHSTYSDGVGTVSEIAAAAASAGVDFVLLTDHSSLDAISNGEAKWYESKVLVVVGTEITTDLGHVLALRVPPQMSVQPDTIDNVSPAIEKYGGYGIVALPCDLKDHWRDFSRFPANYGLEVFNLSSIARTKINIPGLILTFLRYIIGNKDGAFHLVASRPNKELKLWDSLCTEHHKVGRNIPKCVGSLDAHGVVKVARRKYNIPTYSDVFGVLSTHLILRNPLSRNNDASESDIEAINSALESGSSYICYDLFGPSNGFSFLISDDDHEIGLGGRVKWQKGRKLTLKIHSPDSKSIIRVLRNGRIIFNTRGADLIKSINKPGVYRVEVSNYSRNIGALCFGVHPWIFSNPIEVVT